MRIAVEQLQIAGQLLHAVDVAPAFQLHGHRRAVRVPAEDVDRADRGRVLAADQGVTLTDRLDAVGEQLLEVSLHPVLDEPRVDTQLVGRVMEDLLHRDDQFLARLVHHGPDALVLIGALLQGARRGHPVERFVRPVVGVDRDAAVRLHQDQTGGGGQVGGEPARVVDGATGDDETHGRQRYSTIRGPRDSRAPPGRPSTPTDRACPSLRPFVIGRLCSQSPGAAWTAPLPWKQEVVVCVRSVAALPCP
ncbi:hypothetical protein RKD45_004770 [Streptomyces griseus]